MPSNLTRRSYLMRAAMLVIQRLNIGHSIIYKDANRSTITAFTLQLLSPSMPFPWLLCIDITAQNDIPGTRDPYPSLPAGETRVTGLAKDFVSTCLNDRSVSAMCDACSLSGDAGEARVDMWILTRKSTRKNSRSFPRSAGQTDEKFIITLDALFAGDFSVALDSSSHDGSPCCVRSPPCSALSAAERFICRVMHARLRIWGRHGVNAAGVRQTACGVCAVVRFTF
jgi:hypothetical protein